MKLTAVILFGIVALAAGADLKAKQKYFVGWMQKHNKNYTEADEFHSRFQIFSDNMEYVQSHNKLYKSGVKSYFLGANQFSDWTHEEFKAYLSTPITVDPANNVVAESAQDPPASVDWRTQGYVTPVKDQGQCGSCWAFSTVASTEGANFAKSGTLTSLSEQQLVDCSGSYGNMGCNGGLMDNAFKYIISAGGLDTESSYPYTAQDGNCQFDKSNIGGDVTAFTDVSQGDETALATACANTGPISVAIDASHMSFQQYSGGIYYEPQCSSSQLDHGVTVVGYGTQSSSTGRKLLLWGDDDDAGDDDEPAGDDDENPWGDEDEPAGEDDEPAGDDDEPAGDDDEPASGDYWIVKNSWNTSWGMKGYIMMSRNRNNNCGIASSASYPTA
jgi:cathepsin L